MTRSVSGNKSRKLRGFATLFSVVILMLLSTFVVTGILLSSNMSLQSNAVYRDAIVARDLADSCANVAVNKLKLDNTYTGNETITLGTKQCQILAITGSGNTNRVVRTSAVTGSVTRKIEVSIAVLTPNLTVNYWQDTAF
jgi:hypothetical protein